MDIGTIGAGFSAYQGNPAQARQGGGDQTLSAQEQQQVQKLRQTDREVRAHEQAHLAAAAGLASGGAHFQYVRGPDGKQYAVAGEVGISVSAGQTPEQTIEKARRIQAAAMAPADPSSQDLAVAAQAAQMEVQARSEAAQAERDAKDEEKPADSEPAAAPRSGNATLSAQALEALTGYAAVTSPAAEAASALNLFA